MLDFEKKSKENYLNTGINKIKQAVIEWLVINFSDIESYVEVNLYDDIYVFSLDWESIGYVVYSEELKTIAHLFVDYNIQVGKWKIKGLWTYMLKYIITHSEWTIIKIDFVVKNAENFYIKTLNRFKEEGVIEDYEYDGLNIFIYKS